VKKSLKGEKKERKGNRKGREWEKVVCEEKRVEKSLEE
jgi:hypothetical protein